MESIALKLTSSASCYNYSKHHPSGPAEFHTSPLLLIKIGISLFVTVETVFPFLARSSEKMLVTTITDGLRSVAQEGGNYIIT